MASLRQTGAAVPLLIGTVRENNNGNGIAAYVAARWRHSIEKNGGPSIEGAQDLMPQGILLPSVPVTNPVPPSLISSADQYPTAEIQAWSRLISASPAIVIVSSQYNWGYPGQLKNLLDQLYFEYKDKPFLLVTYGARGGDKVADQLTSVIEGGLKAKVVGGPVQITLPLDYVRGSMRTTQDDEALQQNNDKLDEAIAAVLQAIKKAEE